MFVHLCVPRCGCRPGPASGRSCGPRSACGCRGCARQLGCRRPLPRRSRHGAPGDRQTGV